eukprot:1157326-Pelagomonas_calceolata.AAC.2
MLPAGTASLSTRWSNPSTTASRTRECACPKLATSTARSLEECWASKAGGTCCARVLTHPHADFLISWYPSSSALHVCLSAPAGGNSAKQEVATSQKNTICCIV